MGGLPALAVRFDKGGQAAHGTPVRALSLPISVDVAEHKVARGSPSVPRLLPPSSCRWSTRTALFAVAPLLLLPAIPLKSLQFSSSKAR